MSRKIWIRLEDDLAAKLDAELVRLGKKTPSDFGRELVAAYFDLQARIADFGSPFDPLAGCATCYRIYRHGEEVQIKACREKGHFVVPMGKGS